jgi:hypothetical protein
MGREWSVEEPQSLDVGVVSRLSLRIVSGQADVVASPDVDTARIEVHGLEGPPLRVEVDDSGTLSVVHDKLTWAGLLGWLKGPHQAKAFVSVSVPAGVDVQLGVVDADATVSGVAGETKVKSVSGEVTLDSCSGTVTAETVSGRLESRSLEGRLRFTSVSGELTVVEGSATGLDAKTVSGDVVLDLLAMTGDVALKTVSGDVTLRLPSEPSVKVEARSVSGRMTHGHWDLVDDPHPGRKRMSGAIGDGAATLTAKTVSGDVTLLAREP